MEKTMVKVLFVCTANICRSPTAAAILNHLAGQAGLSGRIVADSAGMRGVRAGEPPDVRAVEAARAHGVALADRKARKLTVRDFGQYDLVIAMERGHARSLLGRCPADRQSRVRLLMSYLPDGRTLDVPDPFGGQAEFPEVYRTIEAAVRHLFEEIRRGLAGPPR